MKATDKLTPEERIDLKRTFCDGCGKDISTTAWSYEGRLVLTTERKSPWYSFDGHGGGVMYPESLGNPIARDYHFCSIACLDTWRDAESEKASAG